MAIVTLKGGTIETCGSLPEIGSSLKDFNLIGKDLSHKTLASYAGKKLVLNVFPSIDTGTCAASVRQFNQNASQLEDTTVLCISRDLPFAMGRFCGAEGIENVDVLSDFNTGKFGKDNGLEFTTGPLSGLHSRCVIVTDKDHKVVYHQQVSETTQEPDYTKAIEALK